MKKFLLALLILSSSSLVAQQKISRLWMERTACFGKCPTYIVELNRDGNMIYRGKKNVTMIGEFSANIDAASMKKIFSYLEKQNLSKLSADYHNPATDLPSLHYKLYVNKKFKSIKNAQRGPRYLVGFSKIIDSLVSKVNWKEMPKELEPAIIDSPHNLKTTSTNEQEEIYRFVEQMPEYPGGESAMMQFISHNIVYPNEAKENGIEGKVMVEFIVAEDGSIKNAKVIRSLGYGCDQEAVRVINAMPHWKPGKQNGKSVATYFTLPFIFKLEKN